jgi:lipopolysaccharide export system ATP-binding protein
MKLRTENLIKKYSKRTVVNDVSVEVSNGEVVGLLGPNGAGKTTTFYMIVGLIKPLSGEIYLENTVITNEPMYRRAQRGIGYLPQEASVFRKLSVEDNIKAVLEFTKLTKEEQKERLETLIEEFGLSHVRKSSGIQLSGGERRRTEIARALAVNPQFILLDEPFAGVDPIAVEDMLETLIEEFGLSHVRKSSGIQLSGGERRRTEIARALAVNPQFILLDEPFAGVDPIAVEDIQTIVGKLKEKNIGVLITDHNVHETLSITDRAYLLFEGAILKSGTSEELASDAQVRKLYLGKNFELRR